MSTAVNSLDDEFQIADARAYLAETQHAQPRSLKVTPSSGRLLRARWWTFYLSSDVVLLALASLAAAVGMRSAGVPSLPLYASAAYGAGVVLVFALRGLYRPRIQLHALDELREVFIGIGLVSLFVIVGRALAVDGGQALQEVARIAAFALVYVGTGRLCLTRWQLRTRRDGDGRARTLILGSGGVAARTAERLRANPDLGLEPVGFVANLREPEGRLPLLGQVSELELVLDEHRIEQLVVSGADIDERRMVQIADRCEDAGVRIAFVPQLAEKTTSRLTVEHLGGLPLAFLEASDPRGARVRVKYALDRVLAALFLLLVSPIFVAAAVGVWCSVGRPIFYRQRRVGRDGHEFWLLKFRSMRASAEADAEPLTVTGDLAPGGVEGEDRRTRVGSFLRRTSIDELPQLLNVLRGEMSLVGPRPERPEFVQQFEGSVRRYDRRVRAKAGLTGWAQVNGLRGRTSVSKRAEWDNHYIENWSLWLDAKIILATIPALFTSFKHVE